MKHELDLSCYFAYAAPRKHSSQIFPKVKYQHISLFEWLIVNHYQSFITASRHILFMKSLLPPRPTGWFILEKQHGELCEWVEGQGWFAVHQLASASLLALPGNGLRLSEYVSLAACS